MASGICGKEAMRQLKMDKREDALKLSKMIKTKNNDMLVTNPKIGNFYRIYPVPSTQYINGLNRAILKKMSPFGVV